MLTHLIVVEDVEDVEDVERSRRFYADWSSKGAHFLTLPQRRATEIRCYVGDRDG